MLRVVLDTNILVSAIISDSKPRTLLRKGILKEFRIVTSDLILRELGTVLRRPKFKTDEDEIHRIILSFMQASEVVEVVSKFNLIKEDPKDDMVVETAFDGKANFVVSGNLIVYNRRILQGVRLFLLCWGCLLLGELRLFFSHNNQLIKYIMVTLSLLLGLL